MTDMKKRIVAGFFVASMITGFIAWKYSQVKLPTDSAALVSEHGTSQLNLKSIKEKITKKTLGKNRTSSTLSEKQRQEQADAKIMAHFRNAGDMSPGAERRYQESLSQFRKNEESEKELESFYFRTAPKNYNLRWLAIETLSELGPGKGTKAFRDVLEKPSTNPESYHAAANPERMLQISAVRLLKRSADSGDVHAIKALEAATSHPEYVVSQYAIDLRGPP